MKKKFISPSTFILALLFSHYIVVSTDKCSRDKIIDVPELVEGSRLEIIIIVIIKVK